MAYANNISGFFTGRPIHNGHHLPGMLSQNMKIGLATISFFYDSFHIAGPIFLSVPTLKNHL